ncbi:uncharacterized protein LOC125422292 isoform X2 [Ziziphus jujuba]|uniref:Uncharacterized protein LOC125422292 isoform X2 n=1 Tax=Ziziphus jujuba TaxID=326968 RepID=A0ABM3IIE8_ZIZJJ|nr:uncharacterized protein LOC125422292 isoform X2 [Ziziphus jujuba]
MINGEGTDRVASEATSSLLDRHDSLDHKSDDGDAASSRYSSFGESEFERYCSANSVMGTPSMCSTITVYNDCGESEFGSMKSLVGFGDDNSGLENFSLGGRIERNRDEIRVLSDKRIEFGKGSSSSGSGNIRDEKSVNFGGSSGFELYGNDELGFSSEVNHGELGVNELFSWKVDSELSQRTGVSEFNDDVGGDSGEDDEEGSVGSRGLEGAEVVGNSIVEQNSTQGTKNPDGFGNGSQSGPTEDRNCLDGLEPESELQCVVNELEREEDGTSSRNEHSEGEDSVYNYGTDNEGKIGYDYGRNVSYGREAKAKNENPLLYNSSVAFGSEDWDDFELETGNALLSSSNMSAFRNQKGKAVETERQLLSSAPVTSVGFPTSYQIEQVKKSTDLPRASTQVQVDSESAEIVNHTVGATGFPNSGEPEEVENVRDIAVASWQVQATDDLVEFTKSSFTTQSGYSNVHEPDQADKREIPFNNNQVQAVDELVGCPKNRSVGNVFKIEQGPLAETFAEKIGTNIIDNATPKAHQSMNTEEVIKVDDYQALENRELGKLEVKLDPFADISSNRLSSQSTMSPRNIEEKFNDDCKPKAKPSAFEDSPGKKPPVSSDHARGHPQPVKTENFELNEFYDEVVNEMEEILLDSSESPGARFPQGNRILQPQLSVPLRDGGSTASISGADDAYSFIQNPVRIDGIEVVGARQKKGDVSLSERLVGVKEYTVYRIRVWSGKDQWEIERRYRDFFTLYRRLKTLFADHGWDLPSPWASVEKESRKIFGNASPDVIAERSLLIQECLRSILHSRFFSTSQSALIWFLSPQDSIPSSPVTYTMGPQSITRGGGENSSPLGKTISLIVEIQPYKSIKQMLEAQHYTCAGCHKHFDDGKTLIRDFAQTLGWGKPRFCEYTGQLFCSSCHTNDTAVLPARVLHSWDFTQYPVSQLAKSYLDSIHEQPMLCVSAVNPFLFSKVPALLHVMGVRKKIGTIVPYVRCPFRRSIIKGLGSRRYLLESNDFFALRDLIDLSKGAFAVLPVMVETVLKKILEHITEQCLICCDVGVACGARQDCNDPSSLIFPFQEGEVERCPSCGSVFHKLCFSKLTNCPCGAYLRIDEALRLTKKVSRGTSGEVSGALDFLGRSGSGVSVGFLSRLFTKTKSEELREQKNGDNIILMGSLPSTSL